MEDNNKLFVFEKKEVILIFAFIVLIAIISFTLGVRMGKSLSLKHDNYIKEDVQKIDLKSVDEEFVDSVVPNGETTSNSGFESSMEGTTDSPATDTPSENDQGVMEQRLREEMEKLATQDIKVSDKPKIAPAEQPKAAETKPAPAAGTEDLYNTNKDFKGKYTIQLYSHQNKEVAQDFADGFIVKGYDVIINKVVIPGKGVWYRVSIGVFDNLNEAKDYLTKEKGLFQNKGYLITQF